MIDFLAATTWCPELIRIGLHPANLSLLFCLYSAFSSPPLVSELLPELI